MKTLKSSKPRGFTLIELMVVIAIIALLSSVVLAALKGAREKAQITKTVGEMKSLQTALELFRNQFGRYPGEIDYPDSYSVGYYSDNTAYVYLNTLDNIITPTLINNKLISKVPHAPNYPNNCNVGSDCNGSNNYYLGYIPAESGLSVTCGRQKNKNYILFIFANTKKINLPILEYYEEGDPIVYYNYSSLTYQDTPQVPPYTYCISG